MTKIVNESVNNKKSNPPIEKKIKKKLNKRQRLIRKKVKIIKEKLKKNKPDVTNDKKPKLTETTSLENGVSKTKASQKQQKGKQLNEEKASKKSKKDLQTNGDFKPVYEIKTAEDVSANWKQLKEIITKDDKKRKRKPECSKNKASDKPDSEALHDETPKEKEVWFDDVDPILLEDEKSIKKVLKEQTNGVKSSGIKTYDESNPATFKKKNSFSGLTKVVALDCEMVGGGINGEEDLLARISIVNHFGNTIYDKYVKPNGEVHDYRTFVSGIRPSDLEKAEPFDKVQKEVSDLLDGKIVVGHALSNDFRCLMLSHPRHMIRDSSKYRPFIKLNNGATPSLKKLTEKVLGVKIQGGEHDSIQDAQAAMRLYTMNRREWEKSANIRKKQLKNRARVKVKKIKEMGVHSVLTKSVAVPQGEAE